MKTTEADSILDLHPFTQAVSGTPELGSNWTSEGPVHGTESC